MDQMGMFDGSGISGQAEDGHLAATNRRGPPNRMNDLPYREWMKFQKSFERGFSWPDVVHRTIHFFTKQTWPDGRRSASLLVGFEEVPSDALGERDVTRSGDISDVTRDLEALRRRGTQYDFALVDLRLLRTTFEVDALVGKASEFFGNLEGLLRPNAYCGIVLEGQAEDRISFPPAWSLALAGRSVMRLRDEKILLRGQNVDATYLLFFQATPDAAPGARVCSQDIRTAGSAPAFPRWMIPKPPPRTAGEMLHPAKYPETLVDAFLRVFTEPEARVLDPMMGTGSTLVAAVRANRHAIGVDLSEQFFQIAKQRVEMEMGGLFERLPGRGTAVPVLGNALELDKLPELTNDSIDYCITSPPYWSMLSNKGSENQRARRERNLPTVYSGSSADLGNVTGYDTFVSLLDRVYTQVFARLRRGGYLTIVVKNVKREHVVYPLAWDLTRALCGEHGGYEYVGNTFWCQDDVSMKPFAVGTHWVSNTVHQYCLHYRKP